MTIKLLGSMLVVFAGFVFGYYMYKQLVLREVSLVKFRTVLEYIKNAVVFQHMPLDSVFEEVRTRTDLKVFDEIVNDSSVITVQEKWKAVLRKNKQMLALLDEDIKVLEDFMNILSSVDLDGQTSNFNLVTTRIDSNIRDAKTQKEKYGKLYLFLSIGGSILIVLLFL